MLSVIGILGTQYCQPIHGKVEKWQIWQVGLPFPVTQQWQVRFEQSWCLKVCTNVAEKDRLVELSIL